MLKQQFVPTMSLIGLTVGGERTGGECKHCWHSGSLMYTSQPPQWDDTCCHCGKVQRTVGAYNVRDPNFDGGHGPHYPK